MRCFLAYALVCESKGNRLGNSLGEPFRVYADRLRFKQIIYNLVSNAVKFTPRDGRVDLSVTASRRGDLPHRCRQWYRDFQRRSELDL